MFYDPADLPDRTDLPKIPSGVVGVWQVDAPASLAFSALKMTFRYDDARVSSSGLSSVSVYRLAGANWVKLPSVQDPANMRVTAAVRALSGTTIFAAGYLPPQGTALCFY